MNQILILVMAMVFAVSCSKSKSTSKSDFGIQFSDLSIDDITSSRAVFHFTTSEPSQCEALYGLSTDNLEYTTTDPDMEEGTYRLAHEIPIEDLASSTTYHIQAKATNASGTESLSVVSTFETSANENSLNRENIANLANGDITITDVSSNYGDGANDAEYGVNNAFDGSFSSEWATAGDGDDGYVQFEFPSETTIGGFGFRSRKMGDDAVVTKVRLVLDGEEQDALETPNPDQFYEFEFENPIAVTEVRIEFVESSGGNTGAKEIQFYGTE